MLAFGFTKALFAKTGATHHMRLIATDGVGAMKPHDFQAFLARLGELTAEQMRVLGMTMAGFCTDAVAIIEARFSETAARPHCGAHRVKRSGHADGPQRYKCRNTPRVIEAVRKRRSHDIDLLDLRITEPHKKGHSHG